MSWKHYNHETGQYTPGLVLCCDNCQSYIGSDLSNWGVALSGLMRRNFNDPKFDGNIYVPGDYKTIGWRLIERIFGLGRYDENQTEFINEYSEPCKYGYRDGFEIFRNLDQFIEILDREIKEIERLSAVLEMPYLLEFIPLIRPNAESFYRINELEFNLKKLYSGTFLKSKIKRLQAQEPIMSKVDQMEKLGFTLPENYRKTILKMTETSYLEGVEERKKKNDLRKQKSEIRRAKLIEENAKHEAKLNEQIARLEKWHAEDLEKYPNSIELLTIQHRRRKQDLIEQFSKQNTKRKRT